MCHSLDFEECSKPKFKSVGLHFTVPQIDEVWDSSAHSHNMVEAHAGGSVTSNVVLYLNKVVTEKCTLTTLILMHFHMML